jgi:hypothetical protein
MAAIGCYMIFLNSLQKKTSTTLHKTCAAIFNRETKHPDFTPFFPQHHAVHGM